MKRTIPLLTALILGGALAQNTSAVTLNTVLYLVKTVTVNGKASEQRSANPQSVEPGNVISQVVTARNASAKAIRNVTVRLPVPKNTVYVAPEQDMDSAKTEYSLDGGQTFAAAPLKKTISVTENGKTVQKEVEVKPNEYTAVRWTISELAAGQSLKLGYRVQVK